MNNKGQLVFVGFMIAIILIIATIAMIPALKAQIDSARTSLDCTNTSLSAGGFATCVVTDWTFAAFIGTAIFAAIGYIGMKKLTGNTEQ